MPRGNSKVRKFEIIPDQEYKSTAIAKFINYVMLNGKKTVAQKIVYGALKEASAKLSVEPLDLFETAIKNVSPILEVKSKRIGGANYQVPMEVSKERKFTLACRWIITVARAQKGRPMAEKLATELVNAYNNEGAAIKKKEDTHKMAEANKAFAHFARF